jgi:hypothetical protein
VLLADESSIDEEGIDQPRRPFPWMPVSAATILLVALSAASFVVIHRARIRDQRLYDEQLKRDAARPVAVEWDGVRFRPGDRVRVRKWAGTFKPAETRSGVEVQVDAGHTGVVLRGEPRPPDLHRRYDPEEPIQILRVRWDPQRWKIFGRESQVDLPAFDATVHAEHLSVLVVVPSRDETRR